MANLFEKKDRHLIPNWRSFTNTTMLGELNGSKNIRLDSTFKPDISDLLDDWETSKTIGVAGDLLGTALLCNQEKNKTIVEIAKFVLRNKSIAPKAILSAATNVLKPTNKQIELNIDIKTPEAFNDKNNLLDVYISISDLKNRLISNPNNPINWIEIARYYSILGQLNKAEQSVKNAISISPENRFILRSAARFFTRVGDLEFAHDIIRKSELTKHDPWLLASEIALATLRDRNSRFIKTGLRLVDSDSFHPFNISELAGSLASVEFKHASLKKSKKLFRKSLLSPNDNSLAQAEWASQQDESLNSINPSQFDLINSFEALARDFAERKKWNEAIEYSKKWFIDLPFSKRSILFGNEIAINKLKNHEEAIKIAKMGLTSHPNDPHLLNNIVYSLCLLDKLDEAEEFLQKVKKEDIAAKNNSGICLTATTGLFLIRTGYYDIGKSYYLESIRLAKEIGNADLVSLAFINYIREEILYGTEDVSEYIGELQKIATHYKGKDIAIDAQEVIDLYNTMKK